MKQTFGVFSDEHFGSPYGLMPPGWSDVDGQPIGQTPHQKYIWDCFMQRVGEAKAMFPHLDRIVQNGDAIDGKPSKKPEDIQTSISRPEDQISLAIHGLKHVQDVWNGVPWTFIQGTKNHEQPHQVRQIADHFGGDYRMSYEVMVGEAGVQFNHEISGKTVQTLVREFNDADRNHSRFGFKKYHAFVRSHMHDGTFFRQAGMSLFLTYPLQRPSHFMRMKAPNRPTPVLGFSVVEIDEDALAVGGCPMSPTDFTFILPEEMYRG